MGVSGFIQQYSIEIMAALVGLVLSLVVALEKTNGHRLLSNLNFNSAIIPRRRGSTNDAVLTGIQPKTDLSQRPIRLPADLAASSVLNGPIPIWLRDDGGKLVFGNDMFAKVGGEDWLNQSAAPTTARHIDQASESRVGARIQHFDETGSRWFEVIEQAIETGGRLGFALPADAAVLAETALTRLMATMTQTFANLPVGVAIFDRNQRLVLFNPSLVELLALDAVWLARMPTLREFLERLRAGRKVPEATDFQQWRSFLRTLENLGENDQYKEEWKLSGGQTLQVIGREHQQGAAAYLFEDISWQTNAQRQYRHETELQRAINNRLNEAIAVFDPAGDLINANTALSTLWGTTLEPGLARPGIRDLSSAWREQCMPSPFWGELRDFITGSEPREAWNTTLRFSDGREIHCSVSLLPDGSTLVLFDESD